MVITFGIAFLGAVWVAIYSYNCQTVLEKSFDLILGHAILLHKSPDISKFINAVKEDVKAKAASIDHRGFLGKSTSFNMPRIRKNSTDGNAG